MIRDDDREPAGAQALGGLGQAPDVDRPQAGVDGPVHVRQRQHDVAGNEQERAADVGVRERQRRAAVDPDQPEDQDDGRDDERQQRDELDRRIAPAGTRSWTQ